MSGTLSARLRVEETVLVSPFTDTVKSTSWGSISSAVTTSGPRGQKVSAFFESEICGPTLVPPWTHCVQVTSLAMV